MLAPVRPAETPWVDFTYNDRLSRERLQRIGDVLLACALILLTLPLAVVSRLRLIVVIAASATHSRNNAG